MDTMKLNNGQGIPVQGFGVFMVENNGPCEEAVTKALAAGCRLFDTAAAYFNETDVGKAIKSSGISREEIFVTSKLWLQDYGYEAAKKGIDASLKNLDIFDFMLTDDEMAQIREMDKGIGTHDPEDMENAARLSALKVHD